MLSVVSSFKLNSPDDDIDNDYEDKDDGEDDDDVYYYDHNDNCPIVSNAAVSNAALIYTRLPNNPLYFILSLDNIFLGFVLFFKQILDCKLKQKN